VIASGMKTTIELPDTLVRQAKQRALQQGCSLKQLVADYIRQGLQGGSTMAAPARSRAMDITPEGLPLFRADPVRAAPPLDLAAALALEQQCLREEDRRRAGLPA